MSVQNERDMQGLWAAGRIVRACLDAMAAAVRPGVSTAGLNEIAARILTERGAVSAPMRVYRFPAETCISVNDEVVHGVPSPRTLRDGDLVKLDVTVMKDGYVADAAVTVSVGVTGPEASRLLRCTRRALARGLAAARAGARLRDIGRAIDSEVRSSGCSVIRDLTGHGTGRTIHEPPAVPNHDDPGATGRLVEGLVITIEPLVSAGDGRVVEAADGWTVRTADGALAAHEEHTIIVTRGAPIIVTQAA